MHALHALLGTNKPITPAHYIYDLIAVYLASDLWFRPQIRLAGLLVIRDTTLTGRVKLQLELDVM